MTNKKELRHLGENELLLVRTEKSVVYSRTTEILLQKTLLEEEKVENEQNVIVTMNTRELLLIFFSLYIMTFFLFCSLSLPLRSIQRVFRL